MRARSQHVGLPLYEATAIKAAKVVAQHIGAKGKQGGWIYDRNDRPMYHGWLEYSKVLINANIIAAQEVTDPKTEKKVTRYAINWRRLQRGGF